MSKSIQKFDNTKVLHSWHENAHAWTRAVRSKSIQSRALITDQAIIDAVISCNPKSVLDLGCGEGWLSWHLANLGIAVLGIDAVAQLIDAAKALAPEHSKPAIQFLHLPYHELGNLNPSSHFDLAVCNFSLLDKDDTANVLQTLPTFLKPNGTILIQTLHPQSNADANAQIDGWREESWHGIGEGFSGKAPWYYRSLASWRNLFTDCQLRVINEIEPTHPLTLKPASIIFMLQKSD